MTIELADRLCDYRKKAGLSQEELAAKLGVTRQAVSKWERAEASPDTDNLILLARFYGVTLDELVNLPPLDTKEVSAKGIHIQSMDGDRVDIGWHGIRVQEAGGDSVYVGTEGIHIEDGTDEAAESSPFLRIWQRFPWPVLCAAAYLIFGFLDIWGGWSGGWLIFLTVPLYYTLGEAIAKKSPAVFVYPVLAAMIYLYCGLFRGVWHPTWLIFLTVPLYYFLCASFFPKKE